MKILVEIQNPLWDWEEYVSVMDDAIYELDRDAVLSMELK